MSCERSCEMLCGRYVEMRVLECEHDHRRVELAPPLWEAPRRRAAQYAKELAALWHARSVRRCEMV